MPEHQGNKQRSRASFRLPLVASISRSTSGEVLAVAVILARVSGFAPVHRFVETFPRPMPLKPL
jgi:hypothetical protein